MQRTTLTPLAMQLQNAERFSQQIDLGKAAAADASRNSLAPSPLQHTPGTVSGRMPVPLSSQISSPPKAQREVTSIDASVNVDSQPHTVAAVGASGPGQITAAVDGNRPLPTSTIQDSKDDDFSMLQAEVAFLGLMPRTSSRGGSQS